MKKPDIQVIEGRWYPVVGYQYHECCDCGLTHKMEYRLVDGMLEDRAFVERRRTQITRKRRGIVVETRGGKRRVTKTK